MNYYHDNEFLDFKDHNFLVESIKNRQLGAKFKKNSSKVDILLSILSTLSTLIKSNAIDLSIYTEACEQILEFSLEYLSPTTNSLFEERKIRIESLSITSHTPFSHPDFFQSKVWVILLSITEEVCKTKNLKKPNLDFFDFAIKHIIENTSEYCSLFIRKKISLAKFLQCNNLVISINTSLDDDLYNDFSNKLFSQSHLFDSRIEYLYEESNKSLKNIKKKEKILVYQKILIKQLISRVESNDFRSKIINALKTHRFDKKELQLDHSIIMGDDGGLFVLMNTISEAEKNMFIESDNIMNEEFLNCITQKDTSGKIVIGKGSFGKIRLALVLSINESTWNGDFTMTPGQLICVKKTKTLGEIIHDKENSFSDIYDHVLKDYSSMIPVKFIRSPKIYDMTMIQHLEKNSSSHIKGYTMQEFLPVLDGKKLFYPGGLYFNQWEHQSRYLIDVFASVNGLIKESICVTDIKPANTLYDGRTKRAKLIDLASAIRKKNLKRCYFHDICEITNYYAAPEIVKLAEERKKKLTKKEEEELNQKEINLPKAVAYSLGKIIQKIVFQAHKTECPNINKLENLTADLMEENPEKRISIKKALVRLNHICEKHQNKIDFRDFLFLLYQKTNEAPFDFGLSESIKINKKCFINMDVSDNDPEKTINYKRQSLDEVFEKFCKTKEENDHEKVLVLIGCSGSGKTTFLQKKYLDLLKEGKNDVIPLYYNLAKHENDIKGRWDTLSKLMYGNTEKKDFSFENVTSSYSFVLLIDGVDDSIKVNFIMKLFDDVGGNTKNRAVVVCRKESLEQDIDDIQSWFKPSHSKNEDLLVKYILPIRNDFELHNYGISFFFVSGKSFLNKVKFEYSVQNIDEKSIRNLLKTPFLIQMYINLANQHDHEKLTRFFILEKYLEHQIKKNISKSSKFLIECLMSLFKVNLEDLRKSILDFASRLALFLYFEKDNLENESKLANSEILLKDYGFVKGKPFKCQLIYDLVKIADLSFKVVKEKSSERISLGFNSESVKNYYMV